MGRIFLFLLWLVVVGAIARAIYVPRWEIAEEFIGFAIAAVIAVIVYVVKWLKASNVRQIRNLSEKIQTSYEPILGAFYVVSLFCVIGIVLIIFVRAFLE